MYKTYLSVLTIVWIMDILNLPFIVFLDTEIPIIIPSASGSSKGDD